MDLFVTTSKLMKLQTWFFQDSFSICPSIFLPDFLFISWILLKISSLTVVSKTRFHENFLNFYLFWCRNRLSLDNYEDEIICVNFYSSHFLLKELIAWNVSKYGVFPGPYFPVFSPNTWKYGPEKTSYLDTFHAVSSLLLKGSNLFQI